MKQMKIAILYICTGDYVYFWETFYRSFREKFLPEAEKDYFVFTDANEVYAEHDDPHIHRIYQESLGWPGNTLYRFRIFAQVTERLKEFDFVFYFNANTVCLQEIHAADFLPENEDLVVVRHPGNFNKRPYRYPYERRKESLAYIPYTCYDGKYYVCGGVNGGKTGAYLDMIRELERRIDRDAENGIIAKWHDESQINRYIIDHPSYRILDSSYAYPQGWNIPFEKRILLLDKEKFIPLPATKVEVYERPVWYVRYAGYLKTYRDRIVTGLRFAVLECLFRLHGR